MDDKTKLEMLEKIVCWLTEHKQAQEDVESYLYEEFDAADVAMLFEEE